MPLEEIYKTYKHNPPHLFAPNAKYMITGAIYRKLPFLKAPEAKRHLLETLFKGCEKYNWSVEDWVILDNHYHVMLNGPDSALNLSKLINEVHKFTALWIKKNIIMECRNGIDTVNALQKPLHKTTKIFHNYWDSCITYERSYFARLNYIYFNPVKHNYTANAEEYEFGSYRQRFLSQEEGIFNRQKEYPWDNIKVNDDF
jgi:putative transposase